MSEQEEQQAKKKRTTVADLEKRIDVLGHENIKELMTWCGELDARLEKIETGSLSNREDVAADIAARLEALEKGFLADAPPVWGEIDKRITALENATGALADALREIAAGIADWGSRMEDAEDSIHSLQSALTAPQKSTTHTEPVPLPRPVPEADRRPYRVALKVIAQASQNMGDVLHITRVLKADKKFLDDERREIISIACMAAGVDYADNLLARAGVRSFEA